jgi:hypothetical protein
MCDPSTAAKVKKAMPDQSSLATTDLANLPDAPRQFALATTMAAPTVVDITKKKPFGVQI